MILKSPSIRALGCAAVLCLAPGLRATAATEPPIIAKARARLAPDAVLDAVRSIHYSGTMIGADPKDPTKESRRSLEIILQRPYRQRVVITSDASIEINGLDDYDGWRRTIDAKDQSKWQQTQLGPEQVKELRADVWENLAFFRGIGRVGGSIEDKGPATIDGIACEKIAFIHGPAVVYYRYFNRSTGDLVDTRTGNEDNSIREHGEIIAGGIHFPKSLVMKQTVNGKMTTRTITFDKITINETFPESLFAVPLPMPK
ncbi:MAG TPA: hypothetical protein VG710_07245 [Opitutus sp.]|nr:hypothetical protein [Opitutus sp.]